MIATLARAWLVLVAATLAACLLLGTFFALREAAGTPGLVVGGVGVACILTVAAVGVLYDESLRSNK